MQNAVHEFGVFREIKIMERVEGGEQISTFEVPQEIYINEFTEEIVECARNIMQPTYLQVARSNVEKLFEKRIDNDPNVKWWFKNGVNKIEYLGLKYVYPANRIKTFYPDYVLMYEDGSIGVFETKSKGDDENFGGFNEKTKAKAEALAEWKQILTDQGRRLRAGIVIVISENNMLVNESASFDIEKARQGDMSDWIPF